MKKKKILKYFCLSVELKLKKKKFIAFLKKAIVFCALIRWKFKKKKNEFLKQLKKIKKKKF